MCVYIYIYMFLVVCLLLLFLRVVSVVYCFPGPRRTTGTCSLFLTTICNRNGLLLLDERENYYN